jgi:hypothetical protein
MSLIYLPAFAVLVTAFLAFALTGTSPSPDVTALASEESIPQAHTPGHAALRASINPETGKVEVSTIPTAAPLDAGTQQALRRDSEGLVQKHHPDGSVSVLLQGRFQNVSVARIDENGKLVICTEDADHVEAIQEGKTDQETPEVQ